MTIKTNDSELVRKILTDSLSPAEEKVALEGLIQRDPKAALSLLLVCAEQKQQYKSAAKAQEKFIEQLRQTPWTQARFLSLIPGKEMMAQVALGSQELSVIVSPETDPQALRFGSKVFLSRDRNMLLDMAPDLSRSGSVGVFSRFHDGSVVIRTEGEGEKVMMASDELKKDLKEGALLLYDLDSLIAFEEVEKERDEYSLLIETPDVTFDDLGGLDTLIEEITDELNLHFFNPELVRQHRLEMIRGVLLSGAPGVGKTSVAKALANYVSNLHGTEVAFLHVRPGIHRSMWYGQSEENVRNIFRQARQAAAGENRFCVVFFDDVDQLGARGDSVSTAIDSRVLPSFLAEIDGLDPLSRVMLIGATNRPDLLDEALLRPGRFGDKPFRIPRPTREAAGEIFRRYLTPDLPYCANGHSQDEVAAEMIETALSTIFSPNGERSTLATLTFRDGTRRPLSAPEVMSGALIKNAVSEAKRRSCLRALRNGLTGISEADLLAALNLELSAVAGRLRPGPALHQMLGLPQDLDVVRVEVHPRLREPGSREFMSA
jgi:proteasome-associated ATPase